MSQLNPLTADPEDDGEPERRLAPPDRRKAVHIPRGGCPMGASCGCCLGPAGLGHFIPGENGKAGKIINNCRIPHPAQDRQCRPPFPSSIPACQEQQALPQFRPPPHPPGGAACVECGRVTGRRVTDAEGRTLPWCGGLFPDQ